MQNAMKQFHYEQIKYLTRNFSMVLIPDFGVKGMISNDTSIIRNITKRTLLALSHGMFKQRMKAKCEVMNYQVLDANEAFTTATCTACGSYNNVGSSKTITCGACGATFHRDVAGCRNQFLKYVDQKNVA